MTLIIFLKKIYKYKIKKKKSSVGYIYNNSLKWFWKESKNNNVGSWTNEFYIKRKRIKRLKK